MLNFPLILYASVTWTIKIKSKPRITVNPEHTQTAVTQGNNTWFKHRIRIHKNRELEERFSTLTDSPNN